VASNKRQRKKTNQAARRAALEAARKRQRRKRQFLNFGGLALGVLLLALLIVFISGRGKGGGDSAAKSSTTTTKPAGTLDTVPPVKPGRTIKGETPCPKASGEERATTFEKAPPASCTNPAKAYRAVFTTSAGVVKVNLDTKRTPLTVNNFVVLARYRYYDGSSFQRTDPSIDIIQGGAPATQSISDPGAGYSIKDEGGKFTYAEGDLVMARTQAADSASAQYFFSAGPKTSSLGSQGTYVTFGKVAEGLDVLKKVLTSHVDCPPPDPAGGSSCAGGAPEPPVKVETVAIEES